MIRCITSDCLTFMDNVNHILSDLRPKMILMDPPYNYGQEYAGYADRSPTFLTDLRKWLAACCRYLADDGSLWVFIPDEWVSSVDISVRTEHGFTRRSWIVWYYTFGVNCKDNFTRSHTHILYFTKSKSKFTFNKDAIPSKRQIIGDKRAAAGGRHPDNTWILHPDQFPWAFGEYLDTWLQSRICGTFKERQPHSPNQLPLPIVERIIKVATNPGDYVYDPFLGTGTTGVACKKHDRLFLGTDVSAECVTKSIERINNAN